MASSQRIAALQLRSLITPGWAAVLPFVYSGDSYLLFSAERTSRQVIPMKGLWHVLPVP